MEDPKPSRKPWCGPTRIGVGRDGWDRGKWLRIPLMVFWVELCSVSREVTLGLQLLPIRTWLPPPKGAPIQQKLILRCF